MSLPYHQQKLAVDLSYANICLATGTDWYNPKHQTLLVKYSIFTPPLSARALRGTGRIKSWVAARWSDFTRRRDWRIEWWGICDLLALVDMNIEVVLTVEIWSDPSWGWLGFSSSLWCPEYSHLLLRGAWIDSGISLCRSVCFRERLSW